jgi:hypothetical protein
MLLTMVGEDDMDKVINLFGKVCKASNGDMGIPYVLKETKSGTRYWVGVAFNGKTWRSRNPVVVAECVLDFWDMLDISKRRIDNCLLSVASPKEK